MRKVRAGLIGAGFVGPLHVEAVRRLGYVDVIGVAASSAESAAKKAELLKIGRAYASYQELLADPAIEVVHICTPNYLHYRLAMAAMAAGKHVVCDKPLALTAVEAREMRDRARASRIVNAVAFNYRFDARVRQARMMVERGDVGDLRFIHGYYLQDWLLYETDFSWRLESEKAGPSSSVGDIGSHWLDTARFITGLKIERVLASLSTTVMVRKKSPGQDEQSTDYVVTSDDLGSVLIEFEGGARGVFSVGQVCPGHKNDMRIEVTGSRATLQWNQEQECGLWVGYRDKPNEMLARDPDSPAGHRERRAEGFKNLMANIYSFIANGLDPERDSDKIDFPTFHDGFTANCVVDAIVRSNVDRSRWTKVEY